MSISRQPNRSERPTAAGSPGGGAPTGRVGGTRVGRRERARPLARKSFLERYRGLLLVLAGVLVVGLVGAFVFVGATAKTYACTNLWEPEPTPSADPSASPRYGYVQPNQGAGHNPGDEHRYVYCPPASGAHKAVQGSGPIQSRVYGPDDFAEPQGWIHNLEHGALVLLYRCDETAGEADPCGETVQQQLRQLYSGFPNSPICNIAPGGVYDPPLRFTYLITR